MNPYSLTHLADHVLVHDTKAHNSQERTATATFLAHLAEMDERKLYLPAAYPSMYLYCVRELHMSEDAALKRIRVARVARKHPAIFPAVADGRLNMTAVLLLKGYLNPENAQELLAAAAHKTKAEVESLLAQRFPQPDVPTFVQPVGGSIAQPVATQGPQLAPEPVDHSPASSRSKVAPLSPERFGLQTTLDRETRELIGYSQELLGHALPTGDVAEVIKRAFILFVEYLEKRKFAKSARPGPRHGATKGRHIPAQVRREVHRRDSGQCTFRSGAGQRCPAVSRLELDHIDPVARGGATTTANLRLRCRAHNQYAAEQTFGAGFMKRKREEARSRTVQARAKAEAKAKAEAEAKARAEVAAKAAADRARRDEVIPWLRSLGFKPEEAKRGATMCEGMAGASLEERVQCALAGLGRARFQRSTQAASPA